MSASKGIAQLVGPTLAMIVAAEFPLVQPDLYRKQIPPVVYLSGVLLFVAGLAIVRAHNRWERNWTVFLTLTGWFSLLLGAFRMFAASQYQLSYEHTGAAFFIVVEGALFALGSFLTVKGYSRSRGP